MSGTMASSTLLRLRKGLTVIPLLARLPRTRRISDPELAVDFVMRSPLIQPLQVRSEFVQLAAMIQQLKPKFAMEIGTARGGTLFALCSLSDPTATIISLDLPGGPFGGGYRWYHASIFRLFPGLTQTLHLIRGDSHEQSSKDRVEAALAGKQLDFLLIDGDHSYEGVKRDFEMYSPLVRRGGLVAFHDIADHPPKTGTEVRRFWEEIRHSFKDEEIVADRLQGWAGIGVLTM